MGLADREYYRHDPSRGRRGRIVSFNTWLIIINVAVFFMDAFLGSRGLGVPVMLRSTANENLPAGVSLASLPRANSYVDSLGRALPAGVDRRVNAQLLRPILLPRDDRPPLVVGADLYVVRDPIEAFGHFSTAKGFLPGLEVWRLVTFQFLHDHGNISHLFFNMFGLWIFGAMVEGALGFKRYAAFYLVCGIFGGLSYLTLNLLGAGIGLRLPGLLIDDIHTPLIGASAGVFGVIMACAYLAPNDRMQLLLLPIMVRIRTVAYAYVGVAAFNLIVGGQNAGGDAAHLGGAIAGFFFVRNSHLLRDFFDVFGDSRGSHPGKPPRRDARIDRILEKVAREGLASLSPSEKRALQRSSSGR